MANIQEKIDTINEELEKLRLPHKLKQYRHYAECLEQLKMMISSSTTTTESQKSIMIEQIDQLFTKLDKSVICGVDQCFVCGTNNQRINSSKFSSKHQQNDKQKQSNQQQQQTNDHNNNEIHQNHQQNGHKHDHHSNDDDDNDQSNQSDRLLQTMREKLRNTSPTLKIVETKTMIENEMKKHTEQESNEIVNNKDDNVVNDDDKVVKNVVKQCDDTDNNETVINSKHDEQIDNNDHNDDGQKSIIKDAKQNPYHNDNDKTKTIANVIDKDLSPSNDQNGKQNSNILSSISSTILMTPRPFHKQPISSSSSNTMTRSCGNISNIIHNNNDNHHHSIISGRSPPIISSYKAYKDFINNYTTATASTTAAIKSD
ncbi:uncharacterized protein LOC113799206 [Dermatophagoides pteronyssinus]|uniref:uncharacterized protein LOC113799206 n=1 Tax=Dermatophagoides pteronyssinus TaxID=6956 RepID=UPI003F6643C9